MLKSESYKKGLLFSSGLNVLAKGIGFFNSIILAYYFGTSASTDIYLYILSVAILITGTINGIDYLVLIPEAIKIRENDGEVKSQQFLNFFIWLYAGIGLLFTFFILFAPVFFFTLFSKFDSIQLEHNINLLYIGSVIVFFQLLNNYLNAILVSYKYFTIPIITNLINSLFAIIVTVLFHERLGITGTVLGISFGYILNFILLFLLLKKYQHWSFFDFYLIKSKRIWRNISLMQLNILPVWFRNYLSLYLISGLGTGIVTSVNFGQMLASLPEVFILTQIASVAGIKLSELAAKKNYLETTKLLTNILNTLFIIIVPVAIVFAISNHEIIKILFNRGKFDAIAVSNTAFCFFYFSLLLPSKMYDIIFTRLFTSFQSYGLSTILAVVAHVFITAITYISVKKFKLEGFFWAQILGYYLTMPLVFYLIMRFRFKNIKISEILKNYFLVLILIPLIYYTGFSFYKYLPFVPVVNIFIIFIYSFFSVFSISYYVLDLSYFCASFKQLAFKVLKIIN